MSELEADSYVAVVGDPIDGISLIGPFASPDDVRSYCESERNDRAWWCVPMVRPEDN